MIKLQGKSQIINHDEKLKVFRVGKVTYVDGKPVQTQESSYEIVCNVQPMTGRDLLLVPEGDRHKEQYWLWCEQNQKAMEVNDRVVRGGINFQIQSTENWGSYTKARIMRDDVGPKSQGES